VIRGVQEASAAAGAEANSGADAGRALEERAKVQTLLQAAQDGDLEALKVCAVFTWTPDMAPSDLQSLLNFLWHPLMP